MYGHAYLRRLEKMYAEVEMRKGDTGHTAVVCALGRVMNRLAQTQEILSKITWAFISVSYQPLLKASGESPSRSQRLPLPVTPATPSTCSPPPTGKPATLQQLGTTGNASRCPAPPVKRRASRLAATGAVVPLYCLQFFYLAFSFLSFLIKWLHLISFPISNNREGWSESALCSSTTSVNTDITLPKLRDLKPFLYTGSDRQNTDKENQINSLTLPPQYPWCKVGSHR